MDTHVDQPRSAEFRGTARFVVRERLGAGGMGVVYRAYDHERGVEVALKTLRADDGESVVHLKREFRALRDVVHPNLVSLGELVEDGGRWFFTMELVEGSDLVEHVRGLTRPPHVPVREDEATRPVTPPERMARGTAPPPSGARSSSVGGALDERRLRAALVQLASGLDALHRAGKIHRDVKPSNVLVDRHGRVVLLDFGLAIDHTAAAPSPSGAIAGTTAYMAPEQAAGAALGPSADWYAMGSLLYEALTGELPFSGPPMWVTVQKQELEPPAPSTRARGIPADLDALCVDLLRRDPAARPDGREILARLRAGTAPEVVSTRDSLTLVGREAELARLDAALVRSAAGPVAVTVRGESGVGKTYLVQAFLARAAASGALVLSGRCYEREAVPFKAFDGVLDELAEFLASRPEDEVAALLPDRVALLAQVFPVLRRVGAVVTAARPRAPLEPGHVRTRAFAALRELMLRLGERRRLVLAIDDLPWTDEDSMDLMRELLRPADAPRLLLVATVRDGAAGPAATAALDAALGLATAVEDLRLAPLPGSAAAELARRLAGPAALSPAQARALADEAGGHPLFLQQLVQHVRGDGETAAAGLRIDDVIRARVARLEPAARTLVELCAVAGRPLALEVLAQAAGLGLDDSARRLTALTVTNLVRAAGTRRHDPAEPYHDRVREAVTGALTAEHRRDLHRRLALALEDRDAGDAEALAVHWRDAGERRRAYEHALRAADRARSTVAFRRAAELYQLALDLAGPEVDRHALEVTLADTLVDAGLGGDAGRTYLAAAAAGPVAARPALERRAAEQFLRAGHVDEGVALARTTLARVGLGFPAARPLALLSALYHRARLAARGLGFVPRPATACSPADLEALDAGWSIAGLGVTDGVLAASVSVRALRRALDVGEPLRLARLLAIEAVNHAQQAPAASTQPDQLLATARALADQLDSPPTRAHAELAAGVIAFARGRFDEASDLLEPTLAALERQPRLGWELAVARAFSLCAGLYLGRLREVGSRLPPMVAAADVQGDRFSSVSLRVAVGYFLALVADRPSEARRTVDAAMAQWSQRGFHIQHRFALSAEAEIAMYEGRGGEAARLFDARWAAVERSLLLRVRRQRVELWFGRGRAALAAAGEPAADRRALRATVAEAIDVLRDDGTGWAAAFAHLLTAGQAARRGDSTDAVTALRRALRDLDALGMALHGAAARRRLGALVGGSEGAALRDEADRWLTTAGVVDGARLGALLVPGFEPR